jgi:hypothetical protein
MIRIGDWSPAREHPATRAPLKCMASVFVLSTLISWARCGVLIIGLAAASGRIGQAADPYPTTPDKSTIQFAFTLDAPVGTLTVNIGRQEFEAWEQPAYPGGHPTFTTLPGAYSIELSDDPVLHIVEARPRAITVVTIGRSVDGAGYQVVAQHEIAPDQLPAAEQGAAPLRELGSAISFKIRVRDAARPK